MSDRSTGGELYVPKPSSVSHRNRNIAVLLIAVFAVAIVAGAYVLGALGSSKPAWEFDGAYGVYSGEAAVGAVTFNLTIRAEVITYNSTAVEVLSYYTLKHGTITDNNQSTRWDRVSSNGTVVAGLPSGWALSRTYDTTRFVSGSTIDCKAYLYTKGSTGITSYVDKSVGFPVEFVYATRLTAISSLSIDLPIAHTNIKGL